MREVQHNAVKRADRHAIRMRLRCDASDEIKDSEQFRARDLRIRRMQIVWAGVVSPRFSYRHRLQRRRFSPAAAVADTRYPR